MMLLKRALQLLEKELGTIDNRGYVTFINTEFQNRNDFYYVIQLFNQSRLYELVESEMNSETDVQYVVFNRIEKG